MSHIVLKLGGSVLGGPADAPAVLSTLAARSGPLVLVVSALRGLTDRLIARGQAGDGPAAGSLEGAMGAEEAEAFSRGLLQPHLGLARAFSPPKDALRDAEERLEALAAELAGLLRGGAADRAPRIASFGERLAAAVLPAAFAALGRRASILEPGELGLVAVGPAEDAELDRAASYPRVARALAGRGDVVVPGFFGIGGDGLVRLFGRGGSDYSAAVIAAAIGAPACVLVKDAFCVLTADPRVVPEARPVRGMSYREAAELARGGAKVIHPRAVEPLEAAGVPLHVVGGEGGAGTLVAAGRGRGARAIALAAGPRGSTALTIAGEGAGRGTLPIVCGALAGASLGPWSVHGGESPASIRVLVPEAKGREALRVLHAALFEGPARRRKA